MNDEVKQAVEESGMAKVEHAAQTVGTELKTGGGKALTWLEGHPGMAGAGIIGLLVGFVIGLLVGMILG
jgi:hypothetical protein